MAGWLQHAIEWWRAMSLPPDLPTTTAAERERGRKLRLLSLGIFLCLVFVTPLTMDSLIPRLTPGFYASLAFCVGQLLALHLCRKGQLERASICFLVGYITTASWGLWLDNTTDPMMLLWEWVQMAMPSIFAGLFLPFWAPLLFATLDTLIVGGIFFTQDAHGLVVASMSASDQIDYVLYVVVFTFAIAIICAIFTRSVERAVLEADRAIELERNNTALAQANEALERAHVDLADAYVRLEVLATRDPLTGLLNHRALNDRLVAEAKEVSRTDQPLGVVFADLDHFKRVNDTWGHQVGDLVLTHLARCLEGGVRAGDVVARYGGEEFVVLLPGLDRDGARVAAERLRESVATQPVILPGGQTIPLTLSLGVAVYPLDGASLDDVVTQADSAMYQAKRNGRNQVCVASHPLYVSGSDAA